MLDTKVVGNGAPPGVIAEVEVQPPEEDEESSSSMPGIPWALPPEQGPVAWATAADTDDDDDEDGDEEEEREEIQEDESDLNTIGGRAPTSLSALSAPALDPDNRWKQHPDRRRSLASGGGRGGGGGRGRSSNNKGKVGRGKRGGWAGRRTADRKSGRGGATANEVARTGRDGAANLEEDDEAPVTDGHYGPRIDAPPCTVFSPREGKVHRVSAGAGTGTSTDPGNPATAALVVGLDPHEQLCFVGAARVRCGRGQADLSGYTLMPVPWGPYVEARSPRWMSLLVVRALEAGEYSNAGACGAAASGSGGEARDGEDVAEEEEEIEGAVDRISEEFAVVVVLRPLSDGPLSFLSAQADADALYFPGVSEARAAGYASEKNRGSQASRDAAAGGEDEEAVGKSEGSQDSEGSEGSESSEEGSEEDSEGSEYFKGTCGAPDDQERVSPALRVAADLRLPGMQVVVADVAGLRPFVVAQDWAKAADAVLAAPPSTDGSGLVLVCGAKGVGKSSMCRFLVNRMLGRHPTVAYMDCDLGQPELTPPGQVSLHLLDAPVVGPPHANLRRPELAYFVGTTSSKPEPLLYSAAVRALAEHAAAGQQQAASFAGDGLPSRPLVVNTDGWVKGMGEDLLGAVIDAVRPRHIVQILGSSTAKTFELDRLPQGCQLHRVGAWSPIALPARGTPAPARPSPQDLRTLRLVAYFLGRGCAAADDARDEGAGGPDRAVGATYDLEGGFAAADGSRDGGSMGATRNGGAGELVSASLRGGAVYDQEHEVAALLAARRPRRVPWRAVQVRVMNGSVPPSHVPHAVNGALVGLVAVPGKPWEGGGAAAAAGVAAGAASGSSSCGAAPPAGPGPACLAQTPLSPCVGLGIVRSVDTEKRVFYVLTPEPVEVLKGVNVLVVGSMQLPMVMLYDPNLCSHPYFSSETVGGEVIKSRNYLLRRAGQQPG